MRSQRSIVSLFKRHNIIIISLLLALFSLHLALTDKKEVARGYIVKEILSITVTPFQRVVLGMHGGAKGVWTDYLGLIGVGQENVELRREVAKLFEVITPSGVGVRVIEASSHTSKVLLYTVLRSKIGVMIQTTLDTVVDKAHGSD